MKVSKRLKKSSSNEVRSNRDSTSEIEPYYCEKNFGKKYTQSLAKNYSGDIEKARKLNLSTAPEAKLDDLRKKI